MNQSMSVTVGLSINSDFKREVAVDSTDDDARQDYDDVIEDLPDTRLSTRPLPEANLSIGMWLAPRQKNSPHHRAVFDLKVFFG
jgi:hypothetical protein